jgi:hypothetical protein
VKIIHPENEKYKRADNYWYIVYRVDILHTNKYYIGSRKTNNLFDNYYGSPSKTNEYYDVLKECVTQRSYDRLTFTVIEWTTKQQRYKDEERILQACKNDSNCMNRNFYPCNSYFAYDQGDDNNPFIKNKIEISAKNIERNIERAGVYRFFHPIYGEYICSISELINTFKEIGIKMDRGVMNVITQYGNLKNGWPEKYNKRTKKITPTNKYYLWECKEIVRKPFIRK